MGSVSELGKEALDEYFEHAGVKGMRWGVRRSQAQLDRAAGRKTAKTEKKEAKAKKAAATTSTKKSKTSDLTDAELRQKLNRLQMEKQYAELTKAPRGKADAGKKFATEVIRGIAKQTAQNLGQSYASKYTENYMAGGAKAFTGKSAKTAAKVATDAAATTAAKVIT